MKHRIAKEIARRGYCSRREAEKLIEEGLVLVEGKPVTSPALNVESNCKIQIEGNNLPLTEETRVWIFHKPRGVITTNNDPKKRKTVFQCLPKNMPRVISIGRLDYNSEGLLILTNDGEFARYYENPKSGVKRVYKVRAFGRYSDDIIKQLAKGVTIDNFKYKPIKCQYISSTGNNHWLELTLHEGKNREIRKVLEHLGLQVNRLIRTEYGKYKLADLKPNQVVEVRI